MKYSLTDFFFADSLEKRKRICEYYVKVY